MKIKKPKRIMSLFLAALMCVTSLVGIGTTAYAAEETDDVYLISYPRDGDSNYNAEWGHGSLTFMNGWKTWHFPLYNRPWRWDVQRKYLLLY